MDPFLEGGYSYEFVDKPLDLLICKICHLVSRNPYETMCCHNTFCKQCVEIAVRQGYTSCAICRHQPVQTTEFVQLRRQIESLQVFCDNKKVGCKWVGEVEAIKRHMKQCLCCVVACEYHIVGCNVRIPRHLQTEHNRENADDHIFMVQQKVEELNQTNKALNSTKALLDVATIELQHTKTKLNNTNTQLNKTMNQLVHSQDATNDVQQKLADSEDEVNNTIQELLCSNQKLAATERELAIFVRSLKKITNHVKTNSHEAIKLEALSIKIPSEARRVPTIFKISQYKDKKENSFQWYSDPFYTDKNYKMCLRVSPGGVGNGKGTHLSVALCLMNDDPYDVNLAWPLRERFKITLLNQLKDEAHHSKMITYDDSVGNEIAGRVIGNDRSAANQCTQFISNSKISSTDRFLIDDYMYFQVETYRITVTHTSSCKYIFISFCYLMLYYYLVLLIGMFLLQ